jgi:hypothetical protein
MRFDERALDTRGLSSQDLTDSKQHCALPVSDCFILAVCQPPSLAQPVAHDLVIAPSPSLALALPRPAFELVPSLPPSLVRPLVSAYETVVPSNLIHF